jgi:hypothetical protein
MKNEKDVGHVHLAVRTVDEISRRQRGSNLAKRRRSSMARPEQTNHPYIALF